MEINEYVKELQEELIEPKLYGFNGIYYYQGQKNSQKGEILIDKNMKIVGGLKDKSSIYPKHTVQGKISIDDKLIIIDFVKIPPTSLSPPIYYSLEKLNDNNIIGNYEGIWTFQEDASNLRTLYGKIPEQSNKATLTLYKK